MAITAGVIFDRMKQVGLDAEGTDHYRDDIDLAPAVNAALEWLISVINFAYGQKKLGEEVFQEITYTRIFQANNYSRIFFDAATLGHSVWTILAVYPKPTVIPSSSTINSVGNEVSEYRDDVSFDFSDFSAKRLTQEEWAINRKNPFHAGNVLEDCDDLISYAYLNYSNYNSSAYDPTTTREIEVRPRINKEFVAISYASVPSAVVDSSSIIPFPDSFANLIYEKSLNYVSRKQGDGTSIWSVTERDIQTLLNSIQG